MRVCSEECVDACAEWQMARHGRAAHGIYLTTLGIVIAALAALPLVRVDVSVQANGLLRPEVEKFELKSLAAGIVEDVRVREGGAVTNGQVLLTLARGALEERRRLAQQQAREAAERLADLAVLTNNAVAAVLAARVSAATGVCLAAAIYRHDFALVCSQLLENETAHEQAQRDLARLRTLCAKGAVSKAELERGELGVAQLEMQRAGMCEQQMRAWHSDVLLYELKRNEALAEGSRARQELEHCVVRAPVAGTVDVVNNVQAGGSVQQGQVLAVISPDTRVLAEVYVSPRDAGLVRTGLAARVQVDAFNYTEWGMVEGVVQDVSSDYVVVGGAAMFRARVALARQYLALRNGVQGRLKKGMSVRACFVVARRSLFQLLFDKADTWLNPRNGRARIEHGE